ncbi:MAG: T9SS type A sorting domain-containing protein, partial [Hymenobacteraceae bacterium]|nr:T9SS type A sorting domain-containing protein [Hymenobacteraceae bacterium]
HGVYLYNVDGVAKPAVGSQVLNLPVTQYSQKAIAHSSQGGNADYFYDFYIPFSEITAKIPSFTAATQVRMVANTVMSPNSALTGPISDIGGVDDKTFAGNYAAAWTVIATGQLPATSTTTTSTTLPPVRSDAPVITSSINPGTPTITGTSTEAAGTVITVYRTVNGTTTTIGTTTVASNGTWSFAVPSTTPLASDDRITATAMASGESVSLSSNEVLVNSACTTRTATPVMTCATDKGFTGTWPGTTSGVTIEIYKIGDPTTVVVTTTTRADGSWGWNCRDGVTATNCNPGQGCVSATIGTGSYYAIAKETGKCPSARSNDQCVNTNKTTADPVITTNPITQAVTTLTGTATASTATTSVTIVVKINGVFAANTTVATSGTWSVSNLTFRTGDLVEVQAVSTGFCVSANVNRTVTAVATTAPVVNGPITTASTSVSGTSTEAAGTVITVFRGTTAIGTTTVDAFGNWTLNNIASSTLTAGSVITATAQVTGKAVSSSSNSITVTSPVSAPAVPAITGTYYEQGTSVSGTGPANTTINVYIDGALLGTVTSNASGAWTLQNLSAAYHDLYAGGKLTATSGTIGTNESAQSAANVVQCNPNMPSVTLAVSPATAQVCSGSTQVIQVEASQAGVIYTLRNSSNTADMSYSVLGTGGTISLTTFALTSSQTIRVKADPAQSTTCSGKLLNASSAITVNAFPVTNLAVTSTSACAGGTAAVYVANTQAGFSYQLRNNSNNAFVGSAVEGTGGTVTLPTGTITATTTYNVLVTDITKPTNCSAQLVQTATIVPDCPAVYTVYAPKYVIEYADNEVLATVTDKDGAITAAGLATPPPMPAGTALNTTTGAITVIDPSKLVAGVYTVNITTTDSKGGTTTQAVIIEFKSVTALPVTLIKFTAKTVNQQVKLDWITASEKNNKHFVVERSQDGVTFEAIGTVNGNGTTNTTVMYSFTDKQPLQGQNYYRLMQVDYDGQFEYSSIVAVNLSSTNMTEVYPNPAQHETTVRFFSQDKETVEITLTDMNGKQVMQSSVVTTAGVIEVQLQLDSINTGMYLIQVKGATIYLTSKLVKR